LGCFNSHLGRTQGELDRELSELEGDSPDYRVRRGLIHLLKGDYGTFEVHSPLEPQLLRERVFALAAQTPPLPQAVPTTLHRLSQQLSQELGQEVTPSQLQHGLYADLFDQRILTRFVAPTPEQLLHRYNLAQAQGILYRATQVLLHAQRNDPGEYKLLFRYLKLFGLMTYIEGDADHGFTLTIDGPTSLFRPSTRYGLALAKLLPALLHVTRWQMTAQLQHRERTLHYVLAADCGLVSHYPPGKPYDSLLEQSFAADWAKVNPVWQLEREVDLLPIPGSVMIPDFRLVHPDGRVFLLEVVGYWRPEYLQKKFAQARKVQQPNLILAISERLNLAKAGVRVEGLPVPVLWFKNKLTARAVLELLGD